MDRETRRSRRGVPPRGRTAREQPDRRARRRRARPRRSSCASDRCSVSAPGRSGMLLRYVGEADLACGAALRGRCRSAAARSASGITAFGGSLEPYLLNEGGSLAFAGMPGEYLTFTNPQGRVLPWLATSWKANADATVWTFQIRQGRQVPQRQDADRPGRRREHEAVRQREGLERRPDAVLRPRGRLGEGRVHRRLPAQVADRRVPVPRQPDDVPGDHPAGGDRCASPGLGRERDDRHGAVQARGATSTRGAPSSSRNTTYWGGRPPLDGVRVTFYQGSAPLVLALRAGQIDLAMQLSPQEGQPFKNNAKYTYYAAADFGAPAGLHADRPWPASRMRGFAARWRSPSTGRSRSRR